MTPSTSFSSMALPRIISMAMMASSSTLVFSSVMTVLLVRCYGHRTNRETAIRQRGGNSAFQPPPIVLCRARLYVMSAAACRPARLPCTRRTSPANSRRAGRRSASRARRARPGTAECAREFGCRRKCRVVRVHASRQAPRHLLEQPAVAVRITERGIGTVAATLGIGPALRRRPNRYGSSGPAGGVAGIVEGLADLDIASKQIGARSLNVGDDQ